MIVTPFLPAPSDPIESSEPAGRERLRELYAPPHPSWVRINLIQSVNGSAQGEDGTSDTLSNAADRTILGVIRSHADVVLIGAQTLRAESYLLPRSSRLAVLTASGDLSGAHPNPRGETRPVIVLGPPSAEARARATLTAAEVEFLALPEGGLTEGGLPDGGRIRPSVVLDRLREHGARGIVCEGGPSLAVQLLDARLVDELCLSTSPQLSGGAPVLGAAERRPLRLDGLLADETGGLYTRWRVGGDGDPVTPAER